MATFSPLQEPTPIGILTVGYSRPQHLKPALRSRQNQQTTDVWNDGTKPWARLDDTPAQNVVGAQERVGSWDSATVFLGIECSLRHRLTQDACAANTGIGPNTGHFHPGETLFASHRSI